MEDYVLEAEKIEEQIIGWYRHFHENPELGFHEKDTADTIADILSGFEGITVTRPCKTGVMGVLKGSFPGRTVAFRADIDALPIEEQADVPYRSKRPGVMHACGHDGHAAMLLGAAKLLSERKDILAGEVRFLFQPAEEVLPGGAADMVKGGVLEGVDLILGAHLDVLYPVNSFGLHGGALMASSSTFQIEIEGKGGHAAFPYQTVDTVYIAAKIIEAVQGVVTRNVSATDRAIVTITQLQGSSAPNIIPQKVVLGGTIRVLDKGCEEILKKRLKEVVEGCCATWGAVGRIEISTGTLVLENPAELVEKVKESIKKCRGAEIYEDTPVLGGEDFSVYLQHVPGFYYKVGARPENGEVYPHHHACFHISLKALAKGTAACAALITDALKNWEENVKSK
ncbi:M20 metallopeptidase family protein [Lacrimispora sp. 210928-DFI.3.58]|uniref:M20 metallopeptidase family protein n=1 Tax=Lacrimispora sp. 210928-DFI.3.58 TaxID=2883214 RepID=UPI001D08B91D|nr:amidohydrolase [Lacrimispora sp. 210928-DFI.3.58]MCB7319270.1 amidohydrolase [Lacrimispora sp. 210928-DFI.3.58]